MEKLHNTICSFFSKRMSPLLIIFNYLYFRFVLSSHREMEFTVQIDSLLCSISFTVETARIIIRYLLNEFFESSVILNITVRHNKKTTRVNSLARTIKDRFQTPKILLLLGPNSVPAMLSSPSSFCSSQILSQLYSGDNQMY